MNLGLKIFVKPSWNLCYRIFTGQNFKYRIYSINRPGRLLNFWTSRVGAYSRWALIRGWALIKFSLFSASEVCLFCNKTINANDKTRRSNKERFLYNTLKKTPSSGKSLIAAERPKGASSNITRI